MNGPPIQDLESDAPLPLKTFKRFVTTFHVVFVFGLVFTLVLRWRRPDFRWTWDDALLLGIVVAQVVLYWLFMIRLWRLPAETGWWLAYFGAGYILWLAEWRLENGLQWTAWAYLGQMFGVLHPRFSVPGAIAFFFTFFGMKLGLRGFSHLSLWEWVGALSLGLSCTMVGLFLYRITTTSSERARLIQRLEAARKEVERARESDAELAALRERERLARELHDSLGHGLVTLTVQLEAAQRLYQVDPARASALMDEMKQLTRGSMDQLRRTIAGLRTPGLGDRPLPEAVRALCHEAQGTLRIQCQISDASSQLTPTLSETIWRIIQEGIVNAQRHSGARSADIIVATSTSDVTVEVRDDGVGIDPAAEQKPGHYGLRGLRERVEGFGGTFALNPRQGGGTVLSARIPMTGYRP